MSSLPELPPSELPPALPATAPATPAAAGRSAAGSRALIVLLVLLAGGGLLSSFLLWQRLGNIQEQLARQSADSGANAIEARALARQAQDSARDTAARVAVVESRLGEVALQRGQLEDLIQSLSRSRDENLVEDTESALRLAQQQTQLTGSVEPLLAALQSADARLARAAQPRLARVQAAIAHDTARVRAATVTDVPGVLARIDDLVREVDNLPLANAVPAVPGSDLVRKRAGRPASAASAAPASPVSQWWQRWRDNLLDEARNLVRVSRIDQPEAMLVAPDQAFFLRENLKLRLLNARLSVLARQNEAARADVATAAQALQKYFDATSRRTEAAATQLQQVDAQLRTVELPRIDETLAALATAGAGK